MEKQRKNLMDIYADYFKYGLHIDGYSGISFVTFKVSVPKKSEITINDKPLCGRRLARHFEKAIIKNNILSSNEISVDYNERDEIWNYDKEEKASRINVSELL